MSPRIFLNNVAWALHWHPQPSILHLDAMMFSNDRPSPVPESWPTVVLRDRRTGVQWTRMLDAESLDRVRRPSPSFESQYRVPDSSPDPQSWRWSPLRGRYVPR